MYLKRLMFKKSFNFKEMRSLRFFALFLVLLAGFYLYSEATGMYFFGTPTAKWSPNGSGDHVHHK